MRRHIILVSLLFCCGTAAAESVPVPRERPSDAAINAAEIVPSPCRIHLETIAQITPLPGRHGPGSCGAADLVRLEAVKMPDAMPVAVSPPAELRCEMATQFADWVRNDVAAKFAPSRLTAIANFDSYDCRGRNRVAGAKVSEHGKGNALDIRAFMLAGGKSISPVDYRVAHELRDSLKQSACNEFSTVLGPGSDGYHEHHIHLDIAARRGGYRICQWDVRDKAIEVAKAEIPMPRARPTFTSGQSVHAD